MYVVLYLTYIYDKTEIKTLGFQENYEKLRKNLFNQGIQIEFLKKSTVSEADLENMSDPNGGQTLIIIDDNSISAASSKEVAQVFTMARHKNCSIVLLLHFIFGPWPNSRIISANTSYFFLLKSPRMAQQVNTLGSQLGKQNELVSAYARASRRPYGYVLVDLCTNTPDHLRIRSDIVEEIKQKQDIRLLLNSSSSKNSEVKQSVQLAKDHHKVQRMVSPQPKTKLIKCYDHLEDKVKKKRNHRKLINHHTKDIKKTSNIISSFHFLNTRRPYI